MTNPGFVGAQAEYASASETMIARKPLRLSHLEAASAPVVAVTAWQMLHDYAHVQAGQTVLILGAHDGNFESSVSPLDVVIDTVGKYVEELK